MNQTEQLVMRLDSSVHQATNLENFLKRRNAFYAIIWYVTTARASVPWIQAALRANPDRLLDRVGQGSVQEQVEKATTYLKRYCGLAI